MMPYLQFGLQNIKHINSSFKHVCEFQNVLVIHPLAEHPPGGNLVPEEDHVTAGIPVTDLTRFRTYALTISCSITKTGVKLASYFDSTVISRVFVERVLEQLEYTLQILNTEDPSTSIDTVRSVNKKDLTQLQRWNPRVPERINECVHDVFHKQSLSTPHKQAVCAWDGELSYTELDDLSSRLAALLRAYGVGPETYVALCFEKSYLAIIGMLAILKAGGICCPLDPTHPQAWRQSVIDAAGITSVLTSVTQASLFEENMDVVVVSPGTLGGLALATYPICAEVGPKNGVYVIFT